MDAPLLQLEGVRKSYGPVTALAGLTATIDGKVVGLLGPNGAGKSTLLKILLGLVPGEGAARVLGRDTRTHGLEVRDLVGYMPEQESFLPGMTGVELCAYAAELSGLPRAAAMERAHAALFHANLGDKRYQPVAGYSTGMKQRVKLAQALVHDPTVLFLDEPTNGLDPAGRDEMLALIADLPARRGISVILSTHLLPDVERVCDQVVVLNQGKLLFSGPLDELRGGADLLRYEVRVKAGLDALAARLRGDGLKVELAAGALHVELPGGDTARLFDAAAALGLQIRHLVPVRASLEAAFLRAVAP